MKAKGFDVKSLAVQHGEKIVLGVIGLLVLLALVRTTWKTYDKNPKQLSEKAKETQQRIEQSVWPKDEQQKYAADDRLQVKIASMLEPIPGDVLRDPETGRLGYKYSISPSFNLYPKQKLLADPEWYPVEQLIASAGRIAVAKRTAFVEGGEEGLIGPDGVKQPADGKSKPKPKFKVRRGGAGEGEAGLGNDLMDPMADSVNGATPGGTRRPSYVRQPPNSKRPPGATPGGMRRPGTPGPGGALGGVNPMGGMEPPEGAMDEGYAGGQYEVDGKRFVAVRGAYPIKRQAEAYEKALNLDQGIYDPRLIVQVYDFHLQRQMSADGGKTWGEWKEVDKQVLIDYFKNTVGQIEPDVVDPGVTLPELTTPLPMRLLRVWDEDATHPALTRYRLSKAGREKQRLIEEAIAKEVARRKQLARHASKGLADIFGGNYVQERNEIMQDDNAMRNVMDYVTQMESPDGVGTNGNLNDPKRLEELKSQITAAGDLVLFRYFDFDVLPGMSYRYRVQLELRNPNFGRPKDELQPKYQYSSDKRYVTTEWSNVTGATTVPVDVKYYLTGADQMSTLKMTEPAARLKLFQWFPELGATVRGHVAGVKPGEFLAGKDINTTRIDPGQAIMLDPAETEFETRVLMLDVEPGSQKLDSRHMRELGLGGLRKLNLVDEAVVLDERGDVKLLDPLTTAAQEKQDDQYYEEMKTALADWKYDPQEAMTEEEGMVEGEYMEGDIDSVEPRSLRGLVRKGRKSSSRSRRRRGGRSKLPGAKDGPGGGHGGK